MTYYVIETKTPTDQFAEIVFADDERSALDEIMARYLKAGLFEPEELEHLIRFRDQKRSQAEAYLTGWEEAKEAMKYTFDD